MPLLPRDSIRERVLGEVPHPCCEIEGLARKVDYYWKMKVDYYWNGLNTEIMTRVLELANPDTLVEWIQLAAKVESHLRLIKSIWQI